MNDKLEMLAASVLLGFALILGACAIQLAEVPEEVRDYQLPTLSECPMEDSDNCYWNGDIQGNGEGDSFIVIDGTVYYIP